MTRTGNKLNWEWNNVGFSLMVPVVAFTNFRTTLFRNLYENHKCNHKGTNEPNGIPNSRPEVITPEALIQKKSFSTTHVTQPSRWVWIRHAQECLKMRRTWAYRGNNQPGTTLLTTVGNGWSVVDCLFNFPPRHHFENLSIISHCYRLLPLVKSI